MSSRLGRVLSVGAIVSVTLASALFGAKSSRTKGRIWYRLLRKSKANPPDGAFGPVWSILYGLSATSASRIALSESSRERTSALAIWAVQQLLNAIWSPLFFGKQKPRSALADVLGLGATLVALIRATKKVDRTASNLLVPYLVWVAFASYLNYAIVKKNPKWLLSNGKAAKHFTRALHNAITPLLHA
ncbi:MAG: TspO/MBR family protein [Polyangiaceae bacterium]